MKRRQLIGLLAGAASGRLAQFASGRRSDINDHKSLDDRLVLDYHDVAQQWPGRRLILYARELEEGASLLGLVEARSNDAGIYIVSLPDGRRINVIATNLKNAIKVLENFRNRVLERILIVVDGACVSSQMFG
jgi:hypothetical protein